MLVLCEQDSIVHCGQSLGLSLSEDSNAPRRRFKIQRRQATPGKGLLMGRTLYGEFDSWRAARKQRVCQRLD